MQIYALNEKGEKVSPEFANRNQDYFCLECQSPIRLRGGKTRRLHFYHREKSPLCRQNGKSLTHLQIQIALQKRIALGESHMEHGFPEVRRIADLYWPEKGLVFEIQCSPISPQEIRERVEDYAKLGLKVVWILHDRLYNQRKLTAQEKSLYFLPHYYTNMNFLGRGKIYDQYFLLSGGKIHKKSPRFPIEVEKPLFFEKVKFKAHFPKEREKWGLFFSGDLYHRPFKDFVLKRERPGFIYAFFKAFFADFLEKNSL